MKKFGTPIGAGPGRAKENVGFAGVGTPPEDLGAGGLDAFFWLVVEEACFWELAEGVLLVGLGEAEG
jgi:hypothetical protein